MDQTVRRSPGPWVHEWLKISWWLKMNRQDFWIDAKLTVEHVHRIKRFRISKKFWIPNPKQNQKHGKTTLNCTTWWSRDGHVMSSTKIKIRIIVVINHDHKIVFENFLSNFETLYLFCSNPKFFQKSDWLIFIPFWLSLNAIYLRMAFKAS